MSHSTKLLLIAMAVACSGYLVFIVFLSWGVSKLSLAREEQLHASTLQYEMAVKLQESREKSADK